MQTRNYIGGEWVEADDGATVAVTDPATDEHLADVPSVGKAEVDRAIESAARVQPEWAARPAFERCNIVRRMADLMMRDQERLARLMTAEEGKPLAEAKGEIAYAASFLEWAAEEAKRVEGDIIPASQKGKRILAIRQPVGVTAAITPWNFPSAMITRKLGPALASGCAMVVKPAEATPLSAFAIGEIAAEAGLPGGLCNIVTGDAATIGDTLLASATVRKFSFTGSTKVGRILMEKAAQHLTRLSLELGGHAPFIVFDDADLNAAVTGAVAAKFRNMGQTCICPNRYFVQKGIYDRFVAALEKAMGELKVGRGTEEGVRIGPLINDDGMKKVERHVADAKEKGATCRMGGKRVKIDGLADRFYAPTLLENCGPGMLIWKEETFGPVVALHRFEEEEEAVEMANDSEYGLAAYFYSSNASRVTRVAEALEYGIVGANDGAPSTAQAPFGGVKHSGFGREGGKYVMDEYTSVKYISLGLP
ncbi:MAG: NAD-dependent succinate-semialdehyde dehydrogenase [Planctomycetota bacterium]|nr:NAD-dependent succinate-semialdehyde dehydrogenase [Planctomycetota bacterium]